MSQAKISRPKQEYLLASIPFHLLRCPLIPDGTKLTYAALLHLAEDFHQCTYSVHTISSTAGLGYRQTCEHLATLVKLGLISRKRRQRGDTSITTFLASPILEGHYEGIVCDFAPCGNPHDNKERLHMRKSACLNVRNGIEKHKKWVGLRAEYTPDMSAEDKEEVEALLRRAHAEVRKLKLDQARRRSVNPLSLS